jgi:hypothetical protein
VASTYTLDITPLTFVAELSSNNLFLSDKKGFWNFGDGSVSDTLSAKHVFKWPGLYNVTFYAYTSAGNAVPACTTFQVSAYNYIGNFLRTSYLGEDQITSYNAGRPTDDLILTRYNSWHSYPALSAEGYTVSFYASGSNSDYLDLEQYSKDPWAHLNAYFFFVKKQTNQFEILSSAKTSMDLIYVYLSDNQIKESSNYVEGSVFAGTSGIVTLNYVDQTPKNLTNEQPILLFFELNTKGFPTKEDILASSNNEFREFPIENFYSLELPVKIRYNPASQLSFSSNGIDGEGYVDGSFSINPIKWQNYPVSFFVKMKSDSGYSTKHYPKLTFNRTTNFFDLTCDLISLSTNLAVPGITFYKNNSVKNVTRTGGFYPGYFVSNVSVENVALTASVRIFDDPYYAKDSPYAWLGQGLDYYSFYITSSADVASKLYRYEKSRIYNACGPTLSVVLSSSFNSPTIFAGILKNPWPIAVSPVEDDAVWLADSDRDMIYKLSKDGKVLLTVNLANAAVSSNNTLTYQNLSGPLSGATPSSIALDGDANAWVTLYTAGSALKLDKTTGYVIGAAYPTYPTVDFSILHSFSGGPIVTLSGLPVETFLDYTLPAISGVYATETTMLPSSIETDLNNNIWIAYSNPLKGYLIKYNSTGTLISAYEFPTLYSPQQLLTERNNKVYMTVMTYLQNPSGILGRNDFIYKYDSDTNLLESGYPLSGYSALGPLAVDKDQFVYALYNREEILRIKEYNNITSFIAGSGTNLTDEYQSIEAIATDTENNLWIVHSFDKKIYLYPLDDPFIPNSIGGVNRIDIQDVNPCNLRAYGDWTGMRWINKYYFNTRTRTITGQSNSFNIYPLSGKYGIAKINEDFDAIGNIKSYVLQESLMNSPIFFNNLLGPIVGNNNSPVNTLGKRIYEKIANFAINNSDVDLCEIKQLKSMQNLIGITLQDYNFPFPSDLQRLVNLFSCKQTAFKGQPNQFTFNYDKKQTISNPNYGRNLGSKLSVETSVVPTSGFVVLYEKFGEVYSEGELTNPGVLKTCFVSGGTQVVPLSDINAGWGWPLVLGDGVSGTEVGRYYDIYNHNPGSDEIYYDGIVDWNSLFTTITKQQSSRDAWFNDDQIVDNMINYQLSFGLGILSAG